MWLPKTAPPGSAAHQPQLRDPHPSPETTAPRPCPASCGSLYLPVPPVLGPPITIALRPLCSDKAKKNLTFQSVQPFSCELRHRVRLQTLLLHVFGSLPRAALGRTSIPWRNTPRLLPSPSVHTWAAWACCKGLSPSMAQRATPVFQQHSMFHHLVEPRSAWC